MATIIDGKAVAARVARAGARATWRRSRPRPGRRPGLATVLVGDDPASAIYVGGKQKACEGGGHRGLRPPPGRGHHARGARRRSSSELNADPAVSGIIVQLPLPGHLDGTEMTGLVRADKDVDGLTADERRPARARPPRPAAVHARRRHAPARPRPAPSSQGAEAVVIGRSNLFGKPMAQLLLAGQRDGHRLPLPHARPPGGRPPRRRPHRRGRPGPDGQAPTGSSPARPSSTSA